MDRHRSFVAVIHHLNSNWLDRKEVVIDDLEQGDADRKVSRNALYGGRRHVLEQESS